MGKALNEMGTTEGLEVMDRTRLFLAKRKNI